MNVRKHKLKPYYHLTPVRMAIAKTKVKKKKNEHFHIISKTINDYSII
jgi:hypothetical protein